LHIITDICSSLHTLQISTSLGTDETESALSQLNNLWKLFWLAKYDNSLATHDGQLGKSV
jgi:hypothetical protein